ncbi:MAG: AraC family transcriptional regulator [Acidobacteria bacterium]|nr:AraC family transcriptional regulator [Acidobacteriota bacterium]
MDKQPIEHSALLVIDAQDSFKLGPHWERRSNPDFEANLDALIQAWRAADLPVIFILHHDEDPGFRPGDPEVRLMSFIDRRESEPLLFKNTRNSFTSTDLQQRLEGLGVRRLVITGIQTEQCCETTARLAADLGYDVDFVTEATMSFPILNRENGEELATDEIIHRTEFVLRGRFARIVRVAGLTAELQGALTSAAR